MKPVLIGYFPKASTRSDDTVKISGVEEICSVSDCISDSPEGWIDHWYHNEMWVYDTPELAWSVVSEAERSRFQMYAYGMYPFLFHEGKSEPFKFSDLSVTPLSDAFERLGYDIVCRSPSSAQFGCSPLSCNSLANEVPVNRYCLIEDEETAMKVVEECGPIGCEPGPYCVIEVWRVKQGG